jgi:hypothetical protein
MQFMVISKRIHYFVNCTNLIPILISSKVYVVDVDFYIHSMMLGYVVFAKLVKKKL